MLYGRFSLVATSTLPWFLPAVRGMVSLGHPGRPPTRLFGTSTVELTLQDSIAELEKEKIPEPLESTINLMAAALDLPWESGYRDLMRCSTTGRSNDPLGMRHLTPAESNKLRRLLDRRKQHEPIQYILGQWDFMDYVIHIKPPLLCPRPETEELVTLILAAANPDRNLRILDVGCGTGCIGIALADKLPLATVIAIDIEPIAVELAQENARRILGGASERYQTELVSAKDYCPNQKFDIVVSNPPYIPSEDMKSLDRVVIDYESPQALDGGTDGLDVIRTILDQMTHTWGDEGCVCWMETDPSHPQLLRDMLRVSSALVYEEDFRDVFGKQRFVKIRHN